MRWGDGMVRIVKRRGEGLPGYCGRENERSELPMSQVVLREPVVKPPLTKDYTDTRRDLQYSGEDVPKVPGPKCIEVQPFLAVIRIHW
jgi:hypothetical protein